MDKRNKGKISKLSKNIEMYIARFNNKNKIL